MALWSRGNIGPDCSAETQLGLPAPLRHVMKAHEDDIVYRNIKGTDFPLPIRPDLRRLSAHGVHELLDTPRDDFSKLRLVDHASSGSVVFRRDLFVARLIAWPLEDPISYGSHDTEG